MVNYTIWSNAENVVCGDVRTRNVRLIFYVAFGNTVNQTTESTNSFRYTHLNIRIFDGQCLKRDVRTRAYNGKVFKSYYYFVKYLCTF